MVEVESDEQARAERFPGSPTIRIDGEDAFPAGDGEPYSLTCRVYRLRDGRVSPTPDPEDLREAVRRAQMSLQIGDTRPRLQPARHRRRRARPRRRDAWSSSPATTAPTRSPGTTG